MTHTDQQLIERAYEAFGAGDIQAEMWTDDITWQYSDHLAALTGEPVLGRFDRLRRKPKAIRVWIENLRQSEGGGGH